MPFVGFVGERDQILMNVQETFRDNISYFLGPITKTLGTMTSVMVYGSK